jgi:hypothetical protein
MALPVGKKITNSFKTQEPLRVKSSATGIGNVHAEYWLPVLALEACAMQEYISWYKHWRGTSVVLVLALERYNMRSPLDEENVIHST